MKRLLLAIVLLAAPISASALETDELLALVAMPLAVAAVSEAADVPMNDLIDVVTLLNDADVPPAQFIEVVRYAPAALTVEVTEGPRLVEFVRVQHEQGVNGLALVTAIEDRLRTVGLREIDLTPDQVALVDVEEFEPVRSAHPHGGPPGQIKKQIGVQTGAEVVHGRRGRGRDDVRVERVDRSERVVVRDDNKVKIKDHDKGDKGPKHDKHDKADKGGGQGKGKGGGKGKG